jgi:hypothetical protein
MGSSSWLISSGECQREPGFHSDVGGERVEIEPTAVGSPA